MSAAMVAGRELDALVAEKLFGWTDVRNRVFEGESWWSGQLPPDRRTHPEQCVSLPHYSTDIAAAWLVVEKVRAAGFDFSVGENGEWEASFCRGHDQGEWWFSIAATPPLAICNAALKAVGAP